MQQSKTDNTRTTSMLSMGSEENPYVHTQNNMSQNRPTSPLPAYKTKSEATESGEEMLDNGVLPDYNDVELAMYGDGGSEGDEYDSEAQFKSQVKFYAYNEYQFNSQRRKWVDTFVMWSGIGGFALIVVSLLYRDWYVYTKESMAQPESVGLLSMALNRWNEVADPTLLLSLLFSWCAGVSASIVIVLNNIRMSGVESEGSGNLMAMHLVSAAMAGITECLLIMSFTLYMTYDDLPAFYGREESSIYLLIGSIVCNTVLVLSLTLSLFSVSCTLHLPTDSQRFELIRNSV
ncbi:hypothetical protein SARC_09862 [Sphaeroforma arctica JP610]|uniref:Uncharacterized protein n=1 Tax=Sphaeroforma arctica JP610 TaxID=667725 RepID=A0A0L0FLN0_9EUKA|nr:hypothetical protein SARC_09862 [Sphaeroforma arctica JP610]KNC77684.1 hypothetical protein SARC_09862 [Sphaeroforma arctica JP610]|eukprot:XP_014151586.1 hypothetical protein SARC_09862 [Sphaeroforma arctica JP610]